MKKYFRTSIPKVLIIIFLSVIVMTFWWQVLFSGMTQYQTKVRAYDYLSSVLQDFDENTIDNIQKFATKNKLQIVDKCSELPCVRFQRFSIAITKSYYIILEKKRQRLLNMLNWEAGFLLLVLTISCVYFFYNIFSERKEHRERLEFLTMATHELKRPVHSLNLLLQSLRAGSIPDEKQNNFIEKGLEDIEELSTQLQKTLKLQEVQIETPKKEAAYSIASLLEQLCQKIASERLILHLTKKPIVTTVNKQALLTICENLIENALKYSTTTIEISLKRSKSKNIIVIKDSGIGLSLNEKEKIGRLFFRSNRIEVQNKKGSGVGLFLVNKLVDSLGLRLEAESPGENQGTTFTIVI